MKTKQVKKTVYILPNLLTAGNLCAGFYAIIAAVNHEFERAAVALVLAGILDIFDGKIARFTGSSSRFGMEFDSLADLLSFGAGPAVLMYLWALQPYGRAGWVAAFLIVACGALRLARFNVQADTSDRKWFIGLPIPAASACAATTILLLKTPVVFDRPLGIVFILQAYLLAFLMVSTVRYRSFKELGMRQKHPFSFLVSAVFLFSIIALRPRITLFTMAVVYVLSGPVEMVLAPLLRKGLPAVSGEKRRKANQRPLS
jgi:CDP-diacylglycerol--serine O-phosphatidyltransferase